MKITNLLNLLKLFVFLLSTTLISQNNYFVSPSGNNSNSGTQSNAWATIQYGLTQMQNGDILNVMEGTFYEKISLPTSGLTIKNAPGASPVLDAQGISSQEAIIQIYNVNDILIEGLELQNNIMLDAQGILVAGTSDNIAIRNNKIHDIHFSSDPNEPANSGKNAQGIIVYGNNSNNAITNLSITNNEMYDCRLGYSEGIAVNGNVDGFEIVNNLVYDLTNIGIDAIGHEGTSSNAANDQARNGLIKGNTVYNCVSPYATSAGIYVDGGKSIVIELNTSYNNGYGIEVGCENVGKTTDAIIIRSNIIYNNVYSGIAIGGYSYPAESGKVTNSGIYGNSTYNNDLNNNYVGEVWATYNEGLVVENNIFYFDNSHNVALNYKVNNGPGNNLNYNVYHSLSGGNNAVFSFEGVDFQSFAAFQANSGQGSNSMFSDPLYADLSSFDFHLSENSPAIDNGNPNYNAAFEEVDIDMEPRVAYIVDCGADESSTVLNNSDISQNTFQFYPNPTTASIFVPVALNDMRFEIISLNGRLIKKGVIAANSIDLSELPAALYIIKIVDDSGQTNFKSIKVIKR
jgi:hypothetical protein